MSALLYLHAVFPLVQSPNLKDPSAQTRGWRALAYDVEQMRVASEACWIATSSYATTGQLAYALEDKAPVVQLTERVLLLHAPAAARCSSPAEMPRHFTWSSNGAARGPCWRNASVASLSSKLLCAASAERSWPATRVSARKSHSRQGLLARHQHQVTPALQSPVTVLSCKHPSFVRLPATYLPKG